MIGAKATVGTKTLTLANTEYSISIPAGAIRFELKERTGASLIRVYYASGGDYITIPYGASYSESDIKGPITIYLQSSDAGAVVEYKYWK